MQQLESGWIIETERGPGCLFVALHGPPELQAQESHLADELCDLLDRHFTNRLVLELDDLTVLKSNIIGQLVVINKRLNEIGGMLRLCGLTEACREVLRSVRLDTCLAQYRDREEAVMGSGFRPLHPK